MEMKTAKEWAEILDNQPFFDPDPWTKVIAEIQKEAFLRGAMTARGGTFTAARMLAEARAHVATMYPVLVEIADRGCSSAAVLGGPDCGKCGPCLALPVSREVLEQHVRSGWSDWMLRAENAEAEVEQLRAALIPNPQPKPTPGQRKHARKLTRARATLKKFRSKP